MNIWLNENNVAIGDSWFVDRHVDSEAIGWILKERAAG